MSYYSLSPDGSYCSFLVFNWSFLFWVFWHYVCFFFQIGGLRVRKLLKVNMLKYLEYYGIAENRIKSSFGSGVFHKPLKPDCSRSLSQVSNRASVKPQSALGAILRNTPCRILCFTIVPNFQFFHWNVKKDRHTKYLDFCA